MIITMETLYSTIQVGDHIHYQVSETTWQCYVRYIRWAKVKYQTVALKFQGGWGIKIPEREPVVPMSLRLSTEEERYDGP